MYVLTHSQEASRRAEEEKQRRQAREQKEREEQDRRQREEEERVSEWAGEQADVLWFMIETGTMFTYIQYMHAVWLNMMMSLK